MSFSRSLPVSLAANSSRDRCARALGRSAVLGLTACVSLVTLSAALSTAHAAGQVNTIRTSQAPATPFRYTVNGIDYTWGLTNNELLEGFATGGLDFGYLLAANRVELKRDDIAGVTTGVPCGLFVERVGDADTALAADYPGADDGSGNCDMERLLASRVVNRGAIDLFSNRLPDAKNIERLDYLFDRGVLAPFASDAMQLAGHVMAEKSGNNPVKIAAVLELGALGQPAAYGPMILINGHGCSDPDICYGPTDLIHEYTFFQNDYHRPQSFPLPTERQIENIAMAFVSAKRLGLTAGQRYYGFSVFADDVDAAEHVLTDPSTFPNDTADIDIAPGDDADIYGGMSGYFAADVINVASGSVFKDENGDGMHGADEAGLSDLSITVHSDIDNDGLYNPAIDLQLGDAIDSDLSGGFVLPGLPDGNYFVRLDNDDADMPPGLSIPEGNNPQFIMIAGNDVDAIAFSLSDPNGGQGGNGDGNNDGDNSGNNDGNNDGNNNGDNSGDNDGNNDGNNNGNNNGDGSGNGSNANGSDGNGSGDGSDGDGAGDGSGDGSDGDGAGDGSGDGQNPTSPPLADPATVAVADRFTLNQGETATVDVLANDNDGTGLDLLTLVSVSESPNASISVSNNQVIYRPAFGFFGQDSFTYVMEDSDGTQATGTATATVVHFSDINNDGLNDFDQCDCDSLQLETGIHGSGVGRLSGWLLILLLMPKLLRGRSAGKASHRELRS